MKKADLHIHTHYSDSTSSPEEVIYHAHEQGLSCIAITDHDTIDGIEPTKEAAKKHDIEVVAGIELSSEINGRDVHMLGYNFDYKNPELISKIDEMQNSRVGRMAEMIQKLEDLGMNGITLDEVCALAQSKSVGRPHLAAKMIEKGFVKNMQQAFDKYLADGGSAYVPKFKISPFEAIELINKYGGAAVLAHPNVTQVDEYIPQFVKAGLKGIEVYYPTNSQAITDYYAGIAKKNNLIATGGSDAHGDAKKHTYVGKVSIDYETVSALKQLCPN